MCNGDKLGSIDLKGDHKATDASEFIDDLIAKLTDWRGTTLANIRRIIREADPEMVEEVKWRGAPVWSHDGIVCLAVPFKDKVKVTFPHGAHLADPEGKAALSVLVDSRDGRMWVVVPKL